MNSQDPKNGSVKADTVKKSLSTVSENVEIKDDKIKVGIIKDELKEIRGILEKKTSKNVEEVVKLQGITKRKLEEINEVKEDKRKKSISEKAKNVLYFCPKMLVEMNVCQCPKKVYNSCLDIAESTLKVSKNGMSYVQKLARKCSDTAVTSVKLPIARRKIRKTFHEIGTDVYQLYLKGKKDVVHDPEVESSFKRVNKYEKEIEEVESRLVGLGVSGTSEQPA